jgi:hypothetical protein
MLYFYLIKDDSPSPKTSAGLKLAGRLSEQAFEDLQSQHIIESQFDYYRDFRWSSQQVRQKINALKRRLALLQNQSNKDNSEVILLTILEAAAGKQSGLIAYAD